MESLLASPLGGWNVRGYSDGEQSKLGFHPGADLNVGFGDEDLGLPVVAVAHGMVAAIRHWDRRSYGYGNAVMLRHQIFGLELWGLYAHLESINPHLAVDGFVDRGAVVGTCGKSGLQAWAHLHFELRYRGPSEMPLDYPTGRLTLAEMSERFADPFTAFRLQQPEEMVEAEEYAVLQEDRNRNYALKMEFEHYLRSTPLYTRAGRRFVRVQDPAGVLIQRVMEGR